MEDGRVWEFDKLIDCRGFCNERNDYDSILMKSMIEQNQTSEYKITSKVQEEKQFKISAIDVDPSTLQLIDGNGAKHNSVFYTGVGMNRKIFTASAIMQSINAKKICETIFNDILSNK